MSFARKPVVFWSLVTVLILPLVMIRLVDTDIWWHLQLGRAMLAEMGPPDLTTFYFSPINPEPFPDLRYTWLGDIGLYLIHAAAGDLGLQLLRLAVVGLCLWLLVGIVPRPLGWQALLLMFLFVAGTYHLQLVRNNIFSLPLLTLTLWLWHRFRYRDKPRSLWWLPLVMLLWSFLHGTYLLGFAVMVLLLAGDILDRLQHMENDQQLPLYTYLGVLGISFLGILIKNPLTTQVVERFLGSTGGVLMLVIGVLAVGSAIYAVQVRSSWLAKNGPLLFRVAAGLLVLGGLITAYRFFGPFLSGEIVYSSELGDSFFAKLAVALNNLYWNMGEARFVSEEFRSPFENPGLLYIWSSMLLGFLALVVLALGRPLRLSLLLPFCAILLLALGYRRVMGYLAIFSCFILVINPLVWRVRARLESLSLAACFAAVIGVYLSAFGGSNLLGLWNLHQVGIGRAPLFPDQVPEVVLARHKDTPVLTTIGTGGYLLYRWFPEKRVFLDGFFAPHDGATFDAYDQALREENPDLFHERFGISMAVLHPARQTWVNLFNRSAGWYPRYMDRGMIVFARQGDFQQPVPPLEPLFSVVELEGLAPAYRRVLADLFFQIGTAYIIKGRVAGAQDFSTNHRELLDALSAWASPGKPAELEKNLQVARDLYGDEDNLLARYDFFLVDAQQRGDVAEVLSLGAKILEQAPERQNLALQLAELAAGSGLNEQARSHLLWIEQHNDQAFLSDQGEKIAALWQRLGVLAYGEGKPLRGYAAMKSAGRFQPDQFTRQWILDNTLEYFVALDDNQQAEASLALLQALAVDYPTEGLVLQYLAYHHVKYGGDLKLAENYALQALPLLEAANDDQMDVLYYILANIYDRLGDPGKTETYRKMALEAAPSDRRHLYEQ